MTLEQKINREEALDPEILELLGSAPARADLPAQCLAQLRDTVMTRIDAEVAQSSHYVTIRAEEGQWIEIEPLLEQKVLNVDHKTGIESYLLRLRPGAAPQRHQHEADELCVVLEGDVSFDDLHLRAGDYHLARKDSWHGSANTVHGALLFLQSALEPAHAVA